MKLGNIMNHIYYSEKERVDAGKVDSAIRFMNQSQISNSLPLLFDVIQSSRSEEYVYQYEEDDNLYIKFWDKNEYTHFVTFIGNETKYKKVIWLPSAYPRAYYWLHLIASQSNQYEKALILLNSGYELEQTNSLFMIGYANVYNKMNNHNQSLESYKKIGDVNPFISPKIKAVALRGEGVQLIELGRLEEAELALYKSLELDPKNEIAINELVYISEQKKNEQHFIPRILFTNTYNEKNYCMYCRTEFKEGILRSIKNDKYYICNDCYEKHNRK